MIVAFVCIAAVATLLRAVATAGQTDLAIPWRTLAINTIGSLLLGIIVGAQITDHLGGVVGVRFADHVLWTSAGLGSLTTFSTVAAETAMLLDGGRRAHAAGYVGLTVTAGVIAALFGITIGEIT